MPHDGDAALACAIWDNLWLVCYTSLPIVHTWSALTSGYSPDPSLQAHMGALRWLDAHSVREAALPVLRSSRQICVTLDVANPSAEMCTDVLQALPFDREGLEMLLTTGMEAATAVTIRASCS